MGGCLTGAQVASAQAVGPALILCIQLSRHPMHGASKACVSTSANEALLCLPSIVTCWQQVAAAVASLTGVGGTAGPSCADCIESQAVQQCSVVLSLD